MDNPKRYIIIQTILYVLIMYGTGMLIFDHTEINYIAYFN